MGLNHIPVPSPSFNLKLNGPKQLYFKGAVQRSIDPGGGPATIARNATALRFLVKGDKMVNVYEAGYNHPPVAASHESWVRAGYIHNTTPFPNSRTGIPTPGNFCAYILADHQFLQSNRTGPNQGIYAGASAIGDSTDLNAYTRYYEFRLYDEGPFPSRPGDTLSMVASHSDFSRYTVAGLAAQGKTFWRNSSSLTGSYSIRYPAATIWLRASAMSRAPPSRPASPTRSPSPLQTPSSSRAEPEFTSSSEGPAKWFLL